MIYKRINFSQMIRICIFSVDQRALVEIDRLFQVEWLDRYGTV